MAILHVVGRLGRDAEVRYTPNGTEVATLAVAYDYGQKDGEGQRPTQWVRATLFGKQAATLGRWLVKGVVLELALRDVHVTQWERDGKGGVSLDGTVVQIDFAPAQPARDKAAAPAKPPSSSGPVPARAPPLPPQAAPPVDERPYDDDIPF